MKRTLRYLSFSCAIFFVAVTSVVAQTDAPANYSAKCQSCHGTTGAGETRTGKMLTVKSFSDSSVTNLTDTSLNATIANGSGKMPAFKNIFSVDQIDSLVDYLHQLQSQLQGH